MRHYAHQHPMVPAGSSVIMGALLRNHCSCDTGRINGAEVFEKSEGDYVVNRQTLLQSFASVMVMCGLVIYHWEIGAKQTARDYGQSDHGVVVTAGEPEDRTFTINGAITPIAAGVSAVGKPFPAVGEGMGCARLPHTELGLPVRGPAGSIVCPCVWP